MPVQSAGRAPLLSRQGRTNTLVLPVPCAGGFVETARPPAYTRTDLFVMIGRLILGGCPVARLVGGWVAARDDASP